MKALSVRAPWWFAILHGKPVENRDWPTKERGRILLHASKSWIKEDIACDYADIVDMAVKSGLRLPEPDWTLMKFYGGCIVGSVEIVDCVQSHASPFFAGRFGFVLTNPIAFKTPILCRGALGFFEVPENVSSLCHA